MTVQSIIRARDILSLFSLERPLLGLTEISGSLGIAKPTAHGLITTLKECGFLEQDRESRKYRLGLRVFELGATFAGTTEINQKSFKTAHDLMNRTKLFTRVGVWDRDAIVITLERSPISSVISPYQIGPRISAYCSSLGRVFLAFQTPEKIEVYLNQTDLLSLTPLTKVTREDIFQELERTRNRGYAINDREMSLTRASIACPIFRTGGVLVAAISLSGDPKRINGKEREELVGILLQAAEEIGISMGHFPR